MMSYKVNGEDKLLSDGDIMHLDGGVTRHAHINKEKHCLSFQLFCEGGISYLMHIPLPLKVFRIVEQ